MGAQVGGAGRGDPGHLHKGGAATDSVPEGSARAGSAEQPPEQHHCKPLLVRGRAPRPSRQRRLRAAQAHAGEEKPFKRRRMAATAVARTLPAHEATEHSFVAAAEAAAAALASVDCSQRLLVERGCAALKDLPGGGAVSCYGDSARFVSTAAPAAGQAEAVFSANPCPAALPGAGPGIVAGRSSQVAHSSPVATSVPPRPASRFGSRPALQPRVTQLRGMAAEEPAAPAEGCQAGGEALEAVAAAQRAPAGMQDGLDSTGELAGVSSAPAPQEQTRRLASDAAALADASRASGTGAPAAQRPVVRSRHDLSASAAVISASLRQPPGAAAGQGGALDRAGVLLSGQAAAEIVSQRDGEGQEAEAVAHGKGDSLAGRAGATHPQPGVAGLAEGGAVSGPEAAQAPALEPRRHAAVYGNYRRYYGYRLGQSFEEDPRLQARSHACSTWATLTAQFLIF